jgi:peptide/nickel transport system permease protein
MTQASTAIAVEHTVRTSTFRLPRAVRRTHPVVMFAWLIIALGLLALVAAPVIAPNPPNEIHLADSLQGPSGAYWLGTDDAGRDLFSRIIYGARTSLLSGLVATSIAVVAGSAAGMVTALLRGWVDLGGQRVMDALQAIPGLILAMFLVLVLGPGVFTVALAVGVTLSPRVNRVIRAASLEVASTAYIEAARATGANNWRILRMHILPNVAAPIIVMFSLTIGATILIIASLDFLGLGVRPPTPTWGGMLSGTARTQFLKVPSLAIFPGLAIALTVWAFNTAGDDLRDRLDPFLRGKLK